MNAADRSQLLQILHSRSDEIAGSWYAAIARISFVPLSATEVRQRLAELTEQAIRLLLAEPFEPHQAEAIGASLASLHYVQPEALGQTLELLAGQLVEGLPAGQVVALQPRLAALIGGLAAGFFQQAREMIWAEQEQIRSALITELQRAKETLQGYAERLSILHEIDSAILAAQSLEEIAQAALHHIQRLVPCQYAFVAVFDFETNAAIRVATHASGETRMGAGTRVSLEGAEEGIEALRQGQMRLTEDVLGPPQPSPAAQKMQAEGMRSCIVAPLISREELIGDLSLWSDSPEAFTSAQVQTVGELTDSLAIAIQHARLFDSVVQQRQQLRALAAQLAEAEESERQRLAQALHNQVGQNLTALGLNLNLVRTHVPEATTDLVYSRLDDSLALVEETMERIRDVMADLRPPMLDDYGLVATLRWYAEQFSSRAGVPVTVQGEEPVPRLDTPAENALFRIAQEALTNVAKHAQATQVSVTVAANDETVRLVVADDGVGFDPAQRTRLDGHQGWGLLTMTERAGAVGGRCRIESHPQQGTRLIVEVAR